MTQLSHHSQIVSPQSLMVLRCRRERRRTPKGRVATMSPTNGLKGSTLQAPTSINVAPKLKNPTKPPVNNENATSNQFLVRTRSGGVHRTFSIIRGYRKDNTTGMQLFAKMSSKTARSPTALAARTGKMARTLSKNAMKFRNGTRRAVTNAPAKEPRRKTASVPAKALSTYFMFRISPASAMYHHGV